MFTAARSLRTRYMIKRSPNRNKRWLQSTARTGKVQVSRNHPQAGADAVNSIQPGSSGLTTAADNTDNISETTTQYPAEVEIGKQASERAREASQRIQEAAGRAAQQESGIEQ